MYRLTSVADGRYLLRYLNTGDIDSVRKLLERELEVTFNNLQATIITTSTGQIGVKFGIDNLNLIRYYCGEFGMRHMVTVEMP